MARVQRLPHLGIVQRRLVDVHADVLDAECRLGPAQVGVQGVGWVEQPVQISQRYAGDVNLVVFVHQHRRPAAENHLYGFQAGRTQVIVLVAGEHQRFAHVILGKPEWAGAVGISEPPAGVSLDVLPVQHETRGIGQFGQEVGFGGIYRNLQGLVVDNPHARDTLGIAVELLLDADYVSKVLVYNRRLGQRVGRPLQGPLDVLGGYLAAIVEYCVGPKVEGVDPAVGADIPSLGEVWNDVQVPVNGYQAAENFNDYLG